MPLSVAVGHGCAEIVLRDRELNYCKTKKFLKNKVLLSKLAGIVLYKRTLLCVHIELRISCMMYYINPAKCILSAHVYKLAIMIDINRPCNVKS